MKNKNKNLVSRLFGFSYIKGSLNETKNLIKSESKDKYLVETFEDALERHNLITDSEIYAHLKTNYNNRRVTSIIMIIASFAVIGQLIYNTILHPSNASYLSTLIQILAFTALFLIGIYESFRCYQIRVKKLGGLASFFKSFKNIYPSSFYKIEWLRVLNQDNLDEEKEGGEDVWSKIWSLKRSHIFTYGCCYNFNTFWSLFFLLLSLPVEIIVNTNIIRI